MDMAISYVFHEKPSQQEELILRDRLSAIVGAMFPDSVPQFESGDGCWWILALIKAAKWTGDKIGGWIVGETMRRCFSKSSSGRDTEPNEIIRGDQTAFVEHHGLNLVKPYLELADSLRCEGKPLVAVIFGDWDHERQTGKVVQFTAQEHGNIAVWRMNMIQCNNLEDFKQLLQT